MTAPAKKSSLKPLQVEQRETVEKLFEAEMDFGQTLTWCISDIFVATNEEIRNSAKYLFCEGTVKDQLNYMVAYSSSYPTVKIYMIPAKNPNITAK